VGKRVLLVEGKDDEHVVRALAGSHGISRDAFEIRVKDNDSQLIESIPVELKGSDVERLAAILDADEEGVERRWDQLRNRLGQAACVKMPDRPDSTGTLFKIPDGPSLGIWLMPNNQLPGMLEDFLSFLVPEDDRLLPQVDHFLVGVTPRLFHDVHLPKARIHSWLAIQEEPGKPFGTAITAKFLRADRDTVQPFIAWLRRALVD
jgi:hypothetical protein